MAERKDFWKKLGQMAIKGAKKVAPYVIAIEIYTKAFYKRTQTDPFYLFDYELFPDLIKEKETFLTDNSNKLTGYFYHYAKYDSSKVIIFSHGYGNGHRRYLDIINYLCKNGFLVFSYDVTSFDESEGEGIRSFPQAIIDLSNAIKHVHSYSKHRGKDIYLIGHSMGGYAVGCNLNIYRDIKKVVLLSAFNQSAELIKAHGEEWIGEDAKDVIKYIDAYEKEFFNEYASYSVLYGLKNTSKTEFIIVHSKDDQTVLYNSSFRLYHDAFKSDSRFTFIEYKDMGHGTVYDSKEGKEYYESMVSSYRKYLKEHKEMTLDDKIQYKKDHIDNSKWANLLNVELMNQIVKFFK